MVGHRPIAGFERQPEKMRAQPGSIPSCAIKPVDFPKGPFIAGIDQALNEGNAGLVFGQVFGEQFVGEGERFRQPAGLPGLADCFARSRRNTLATG